MLAHTCRNIPITLKTSGVGLPTLQLLANLLDVQLVILGFNILQFLCQSLDEACVTLFWEQR